MTVPLLQVDDLVVHRDGTDVVRGVNLSLTAGEVLAVLGPNGAGKSTLLQAIGGVLPPSAGRVVSNGRIATAMQSPDLAARTARVNVELALAWWGVARSERRARADRALETMDAGHLATRSAVALSGGEQRRVHLARALALEPDVLLLDEPFAGLDPVSRASLLDDTGEAVRSHAKGVIVVVHDRAEAWALADRLMILIDGRVAAEGAPRDLLEHPPTVEVARFLGFTGEIHSGDGVLLTRPSQVQLDPDGDIAATVVRVIPREDGARADLEVAHGTLSVIVPFPGPSVGDVVRVRIDGGVRFAQTGG